MDYISFSSTSWKERTIPPPRPLRRRGALCHLEVTQLRPTYLCTATVGERESLQGVLWEGASRTTGEISSDLYRLSGRDILNLTFGRLDFHQLLIKIS
jgi:hypothetical protein